MTHQTIYVEASDYDSDPDAWNAKASPDTTVAVCDARGNVGMLLGGPVRLDAYQRGLRDAAQRIMEYCADRQMDAAQSRDAYAVFSEKYGECQGQLEAYGQALAFAAGIYDEADQ